VETSDPVRDEMIDLAGRLVGLDGEQWNSPSLCSLWRIRDVLAHMTAGAEGAFGLGAVSRGVIRHRFNYERWVAADGRARGQQEPEVILESFRRAGHKRESGTGTPPVRALAHVLIHGQDICRPLGMARHLPEAHLRPVADFVTTTFIFRAKRRITGLKLTASDMDWSHGDGPVVTGPLEALVMMMAGRLIALDDLSGEGKAILATRG
jgi:uncharacterized protein (TIGR03083 family)